MMGYYDCPPHPCETLDEERDAKWIRYYERQAEESLVKAKETFSGLEYYQGGIRFRS